MEMSTDEVDQIVFHQNWPDSLFKVHRRECIIGLKIECFDGKVNNSSQNGPFLLMMMQTQTSPTFHYA